MMQNGFAMLMLKCADKFVQAALAQILWGHNIVLSDKMADSKERKAVIVMWIESLTRTCFKGFPLVF